MLLAGLILAAATATAGVQVSHAWARASAPGQESGVVYLTLTAASADRLTSVASPDASDAMLHVTSSAGGMSGMSMVMALSLPAGRAVALTPHGTHIMLDGLRHPLVAGQIVKLSLTFAGAGVEIVDVPVLPLTATGPAP